MSQLIDFYRGVARDPEGRFLQEVREWDDESLEESDDTIQWLFPLAEPSQFNPEAPILTPADIATFWDDAALRQTLDQTLQRMLAFFGLAMAEDGTIDRGPNFGDRTRDVWAYPNHNWLRITRVLRSLKLLGLTGRADALFACLDGLYSQRRFPITAETFRYWEQAVGDGRLQGL